MANFKRIPVLVDAATGKQIDEFGAVVRDNDFFRLLFDETVILCCQFYDVSWIDGEAQLSEHSIDPDLTLEAFGDNDFDPLTSFMFLSEQTEDADNKVNIANDWFDGLTADPANGQLSFRVNTNTVRFEEALNSIGTQNFYFCVSGVPSGQTEKTVLAYFRFKAENRPSSSVGAPVTADPEYLTAQEVQALVKSAPDFEFSIDGVTLWHSVQVPADQYYREQRNGGEWSEAIALIEGVQGIQGETGETPGFINGTFVPADLDVDGIIVITHNQGDITLPFRVTGPGGWTWYPYVQMYENTIVMDFCDELPLDAGTWEYTFGGLPGASGTGIAPRGTYATGTNYALDDGATYDGSYYRSKIADNTGNQPDTSPAQWEKMISKGEQGEQGEQGINILSSITGESFIYPKTGITNPFTNAANSPNITFDADNYADIVALLSTSSNEPMQLPKFKIPDTTSLKFRFVYEPETANSWSSENVIWKGEFKKMTDNAAWGSVTAFTVGTDTVPSSGTAPQLYEATVSLATLGLAVGDVVQMVIFVDSTSTWANDIAFELAEIEVV